MWTSPDGQYRNQMDYDGEALYNQQKQDLELTGSDHQLIVAKFRLKLKKVGENLTLVAERLKRLTPMRETRVRSPGEGNGNPLQYSCLENPMDGEAW